MSDIEAYGDVSKLPTRAYIEPLDLSEEIAVEFDAGKRVGIKLVAIGQLNAKDATREVFFEFNGMPRTVRVTDRTAANNRVVRAKADDSVGSIGAPMPGVVFETKVKVGDTVEAGQPMVVLSAMKMETVVAAPVAGRVEAITVSANDDVQAGDLLVSIQ
jgi:pyruvate carboxylase